MQACWALIAAPSALAATIVDLATYPDALRIQSMQVGDGLGGGEVISCDVNGDGLGDMILGTPNADGLAGSRPSCGEVYVVLGQRRRWAGTGGILSLTSTRILGQQEFHQFGQSVACVDLNGDGFADIAAGTSNADSVANGRDQAGQVHIVFGAPALPVLIDLAQPFGTIVYGAEPFDGLGDELASGDINGDGRPDLLLDAAHATFVPTNQTQAGKVHVLFGRPSWPATIDLRSDSDLTILGATKNDNFGAQLTAGDLDRDGTDELIVDAPGSDRPGTTRTSSGSVYIWKGRSTWPASISLAVAQPDTLIYGADAADQFGRAGMHVTDWDQDGTPDLLIGGPLADGPSNTTSDLGELRSVEPASSWPTTIDLRTTYSRIMYGVDAGDHWCNRFQVGDVNGDHLPDLSCGAADAGGPGESRWHSGEVATVFGRVGLAADIRLANGDYDLYTYGADQQDAIGAARYGTDINDDGIQEISIRGNYSVPGRLSDVYLISPVDIDNDGYSQLADNCPLVYNPDQLDSNADLRGDLCATDWDGDTLPDSSDCAPSNRLAGRPSEIGPLVLTHDKLLGQTRLSWSLQLTADTYDISRGLVSQLNGGSFGQCQTSRDPNPSDNEFVDTQSPPIANSFFYLVRGKDIGCGGAGTWGSNSTGSERVNTDPARCP